MGWASAVEIFDVVAGALLDKKEVDKKSVLKTLIETLEDGDWDTQEDSEYYNHPVVREVMEELHPEWFNKEEEEEE